MTVPDYALGDLAVSYAAAGQAVFALAPRAKHPHPRLAPHGFLNAITDVDQVDRLWSIDPNSNIGGRPNSAVVVLDVDPRNGGDRSIHRLQAENSALPLTLTSRTGSGGWHLFYGCAGATKGKLAEGVDIKTHATGYVVLPGSIHPSGRSYQWHHEVPIAPAPSWLVDLLQPARRVSGEFTRSSADPSRRARALRDVVLHAKPGGRNRALFWACCRATETGIDLNPLIEAGVQIGLSQTEAWRTAQSAARRGFA